MKVINKLRAFFEMNGFEVVSRISDKLGLRVFKLRLLFIYLSFATLGLTFAIYLVLAFTLWVKDGFFVKRKSVFEF
ncbi:MAG: PspC family transcriptional regulator [Solirubrobacteraceae bacterium]